MTIKSDNRDICRNQESSSNIYNQIEKALDLHYEQLQFDIKEFDKLENQESSFYSTDFKSEYQIVLSSYVSKIYQKLDIKSKAVIGEIFNDLSQNPFHINSREIGSEVKLKINVNQFQIYYRIDEPESKIEVLKIARTSEKS